MAPSSCHPVVHGACWRRVAAVLSMLGAACTGAVTGDSGDTGDSGATPTSSAPRPPASDPLVPPRATDTCASGQRQVGPWPPMLLTRVQYSNTVSDWLGLPPDKVAERVEIQDAGIRKFQPGLTLTAGQA